MIIRELIVIFIGTFIGTTLFWSSYFRNKETDKHNKETDKHKEQKLEEWERDIRLKFGYTAKSFQKEFIEPLKEGETVMWHSNLSPDWIVDTALEHYNFRISYKYDGSNWWTLYVEEDN